MHHSSSTTSICQPSPITDYGPPVIRLTARHLVNSEDGLRTGLQVACAITNRPVPWAAVAPVPKAITAAPSYAAPPPTVSCEISALVPGTPTIPAASKAIVGPVGLLSVVVSKVATGIGLAWGYGVVKRAARGAAVTFGRVAVCGFLKAAIHNGQIKMVLPYSNETLVVSKGTRKSS